MAKKDKINKIIKEKNKSKEKKETKSGGLWWKIILLSAAIKVAIAGVAIYKLVRVPELPKLDVKQNWGSDEIGVKDVSIRPYRIVFTDSMQEEIRTLFELYRRENKLKSFDNAGWRYGVNSEEFAQFVSEWIFEYKFRDRATFLNTYDQFRTNIQGLDIHFMRVKPKLPAKSKVKVLPLLLLHGWPGSIREFYEVIPLLTSPREGYDFVFEVIAPSLPGFIYSDAPTKPGFTPLHAAVIMRNLMRRIGFTRFYVQGGDFGHTIGSHMATLFPDEILGFHTSMPHNWSTLSILTWIFGSIWPSLIEENYTDRMYPLKDKLSFYLEESGYMHLQATKPDTIGIALQDSPPGLAAYILDRFMIFTNPAHRNKTQGGLDQSFSSVKLLDNIMLYWASGSITTSMRYYKETVRSEKESVMSQIPTTVPTWALRFRHELFYQPDFILRWKYPNLVGTTISDTGGHFAAFERPTTFTDDVFRAVNTFIQFRSQ